MFKTHEKSRFETMSNPQLDETKRIVLQISDRPVYVNTYGRNMFLTETVAAEDYKRTTAEGRAAAAEKELLQKIGEYEKQISELEEGYKELTVSAMDEQRRRSEAIESFIKEREKNNRLRKILDGIHSFMGSWPPEIDDLFRNGGE